jgi:hypothetical protein
VIFGGMYAPGDMLPCVAQVPYCVCLNCLNDTLCLQIWSILCPCGTELACNKPDLLEEMLSTHKGTGCKDARQFFKSEVIHAVTDSMRLIDPRMAQLRKAIPKLLVHVNVGATAHRSSVYYQ